MSPDSETPAPRARGRSALAWFALAALVLIAAALVIAARGRAPKPAAAPTTGAPSSAQEQPRAPRPTAWVPVTGNPSLVRAREVALTADAVLSTDGTTATLQSGDGQARPLEASVPIPHVFVAAGRLFAAGQNDGAPFLIALLEGEANVVPMPCTAATLAGAGDVIVAGCEDGDLAISRDGGRTFNPSGANVTAPSDAGEDLAQAIEAVDVDAAGGIGIAVAQRWTTQADGQRLLWTLADFGLRLGGRSFRYGSAPGLARTIGVRLSNGSLVAAGLEVALDGDAAGALVPRFYRAAESSPGVPTGVAGGACAAAHELGSVPGVLLGPREAAFLCGGRVLLTLDGGQTWSEAGPGGKVDALFGGAMRLIARVGDRVFERRFALRSPSGATGLVLGAGTRSERAAPAKAQPRPVRVQEP